MIVVYLLLIMNNALDTCLLKTVLYNPNTKKTNI